MRVALVSCNAHAGDAIGNNVAQKLRFFREAAAEVRVFLESDRRLHPEVAPFAQVAAAEPRGDAWRFLRSADLVCVEFGQYYSLLSLLPLLAGGKPRILFDYHGITPPQLWGGHNREALVQGLQQRGLAWCAAATITHSNYTHDELHAVTGLPRGQLPRLGFPLDRDRFSPGAAPAWRRSLGLEQARILLFVGRLAPNKQPELLVEALALLADVEPPIRAVFVGDGGDLYRATAQRCVDRGRELGVADKLHLVGPQLGNQLRDAYRAADVLIVPSQWESFCIPVVEAMACGLPVVATRTTALPETVASAGLTFAPGDAVDLARQIRRVLNVEIAATPVNTVKRVAVVACRFGDDFAGGAEASLRQMAWTLKGVGCDVEVFTTRSNSEAGDTNDWPAGTTTHDGLLVHRFAVDAAGADAGTPAHPIHSAALIEQLAKRAADFDLLLTGPYLAGLTVAVVRRWPEKTIVAPCFHDEPQARLECWLPLYENVAGLWYHSPEERAFAEGVLGFNHPGSAVVGACIDATRAGDAGRGRALARADSYVLYCGRLTVEKNLPTLFDYARRFHEQHGGVRFVFTGQGEGEGNVSVPREPWAVDCGFVAQPALCDLLAGATAVVQLSHNESLSLAALEAWMQATPVVAARCCSVLAGHIEHGGGGLLVDGYEEFAAALVALIDRPELREQLGALGRHYVRENYGCEAAYGERLLTALEEVRRPLVERMRERGLQRAAEFDAVCWRQQFAAIVEGVLHAEPVAREELLVQPRARECKARPGMRSLLLAVRVVNRGTLPAAAHGPGRTVLTGTVVDAAGNDVARLEPTPLPMLLMPGRALSASVAVPVPAPAGAYEIRLGACRCDRAEPASLTAIPLVVGGDTRPSPTDGCTSLLDDAQAALVEAEQTRRLPDDYRDVTQGTLAGVKLRIKQKLLGNFKKAYVDVLSRQQSACNEQLLTAVQALTECCATLDHAVRTLQERVAQLEAQPAGAGHAFLPASRTKADRDVCPTTAKEEFAT